MDAKRTNNPNELIFTLSLADAKDIKELVDHFTHWELIASKENSEPMMFMLRFSNDCGSAIEGFPTMTYPIEKGQVLLKKNELMTIAAFLKACVEADGDGMSWMKRTTLKMAWKTLRNRVG